MPDSTPKANACRPRNSSGIRHESGGGQPTLNSDPSRPDVLGSSVVRRSTKEKPPAWPVAPAVGEVTRLTSET